MRWRCHSKYPIGSNIFSRLPWAKRLGTNAIHSRCDQCIVKSVLKDQQCTFWSRSLLIVKKVLSMKNDLAAIKTTLGPDRSLLITLSWLLVNLLHLACIAGFVKHLSLCTGHNSGWIMAYSLAFVHGKRITEYCSLRDPLNGNVAAFNVNKWRHSDVIVIKLTAGTQHKIPYKTYIWIFSYFENYRNYAVL